jgi:hypothetical protein
MSFRPTAAAILHRPRKTGKAADTARERLMPALLIRCENSAPVAEDDLCHGFIPITEELLRDADIANRGIVEAIVALARTIGIAVIAEGIETAEQESELRSLHCLQGQSTLFSAPISGARVNRVLPSIVPATPRGIPTEVWASLGEDWRCSGPRAGGFRDNGVSDGVYTLFRVAAPSRVA